MSTDSETKSEAPAEMNYAGFWIRLLAFLIDAVLLSFISWGVANVAYFIGMWAWKGQTLGQMVVNVKVVAADGQRCDLRTAVLRFLLQPPQAGPPRQDSRHLRDKSVRYIDSTPGTP